MSCAICGSNENLVRHHTSYNPERILVLCHSCHTMVHAHTSTLKRPKSFSQYHAIKTIEIDEANVRKGGVGKPGFIEIIGESRFVSKIIADGRVTVPQKVRELLKLKEGDFVEVEINKIQEVS